MSKPYTPRPYQSIITDHILDTPRCAVWASMGLGKTVGTLTALDMLLAAGEDDPMLVIAPLRVAKNVWPNEANKWDHLKNLQIMPIVGNEDERRRATRYAAQIYTTNYDNLEWLVNYYGDRWPFATVVSDESTRLKGFRLKQGAARPRALSRHAHTKIKRFIELTGEPSPEGLSDLWGQMWFLDAGQRLGRTHNAFKQRWFQRSYNGYGLEPLPHTQTEIQGKLRDLCISIDAKDYFDIKEPIVNNIYVDLPPKARIKYNEMEREMFTMLEQREVEAFNAAARTQKCLQLANGAAYVTPLEDVGDLLGGRDFRELHTVKLEALESIVEEANGMPVLVSYEFKSDAVRIAKAFPKAVLLATQDGFDTFMKKKSPIGLAHPKSMGHGIDGLQDVTNIIAHFGHNWSLELYDQINARIGPVRQAQSGYDRPVFIYHIVARDTVDELVLARRENKRSVQDILLDAMKARRG